MPTPILRLSLVTLLALAAVARADDDKEAKRASDYLRAGVKRFDGGSYKEALAAFKRGQEHKALPEFSYRLGACYEKLGDVEAATREYKAFLAKVPNAAEKGEIERFLSGGGGGAPPDAKAASKGDAKPAAKSDPPPAAKGADKSATPASAKSAGGDAAGKCPEGQRASHATDGHCCWPEQLWGDDEKICIGIPRCPPGFDRKERDCVRRSGNAACTAGKVSVNGHCCWPEQVWGDDAGACIGKPRCPRGYELKGTTCTAILDEDERP
jgi:hypothetical protein